MYLVFGVSASGGCLNQGVSAPGGYLLHGGVCSRGAPGPGGSSQGGCLLWGVSSPCGVCPVLHASENITLPQTSFAGGKDKKQKVNKSTQYG